MDFHPVALGDAIYAQKDTKNKNTNTELGLALIADYLVVDRLATRYHLL